MSNMLGRKLQMALYSATDCLYSHACRIVVYEKEVECQIIYTDDDDDCEELAEANPYNETPTLIDRDLVVYDPFLINEYLDERLPHPPLMPVDPVSRARLRIMIMRLNRDWYKAIKLFDHETKGDMAKKIVRDGLISISPILTEQNYLMGDEFSLVDVFLAPLLWRLPLYGIKLPKQAEVVNEYASRLFSRDAFKSALSENEREMKYL